MDVLGVLDGQEPGDRERLPVQNNKHKLGPNGSETKKMYNDIMYVRKSNRSKKDENLKQHCTTPDYALPSMLKHGKGVNVKTLPGCIMRDFTVAVRTVEVVAVRTVAEVVDTVAEAVVLLKLTLVVTVMLALVVQAV